MPAHIRNFFASLLCMLLIFSSLLKRLCFIELRMWVQGVKPWVLWLVGKLGAVWPQSSGPHFGPFPELGLRGVLKGMGGWKRGGGWANRGHWGLPPVPGALFPRQAHDSLPTSYRSLPRSRLPRRSFLTADRKQNTHPGAS